MLLRLRKPYLSQPEESLVTFIDKSISEAAEYSFLKQQVQNWRKMFQHLQIWCKRSRFVIETPSSRNIHFQCLDSVNPPIVSVIQFRHQIFNTFMMQHLWFIVFQKFAVYGSFLLIQDCQKVDDNFRDFINLISFNFLDYRNKKMLLKELAIILVILWRFTKILNKWFD